MNKILVCIIGTIAQCCFSFFSKRVLLGVLLLSSFSTLSFAQSAFVSNNTTMTYDQCTGTATVLVRTIEFGPNMSNDNGNDRDRLKSLEVLSGTTSLGSVQVCCSYTGQVAPSGAFVAGTAGDADYYYTYTANNNSGLTAKRESSNSSLAEYGNIEITIPFTGSQWNNLFGTSPKFSFKDTTVNGVSFDGAKEHNFDITPSNEHKGVEAPKNIRTDPTEQCNHISLKWDNPSFPNSCPAVDSDWSINVYRGSSSTPIMNVGKLNYYNDTDPNLIPGQSYNYSVEIVWNLASGRISKKDMTSPSTFSAKTTGPLMAPSLNMPTVICDQGEINLTWGTLTGASGYRIERSIDMSFPSSPMTTSIPVSGGSTREYTDMGLASGSIYHYRLFALNCMGTLSSPPSQTRSVSPPLTPIAPTFHSVTADNVNNAVIIQWTDNSTDEDKFVVERTLIGAGPIPAFDGDESDPQLTINTNNDMNGIGRVFTYRDLAPAICQSYSYKIKSVNTCGEGETTGIIARIDPNITDAFSGSGGSFEGSKGYHTDRVELGWTSADADVIEDYSISRKVLGSAGPFVFRDEVSTGIYQDYIADAGILYEYAITGLTLCEGTRIRSDTAYTVGFRAKSGLVSGNVAFSGGSNAVEDVLIEAESENNVQGGSLQFGASGQMLSIDAPANLMVSNELFLEAWIKPMTHSSDFDIIKRSNGYNLSLNSANDEIDFVVYHDGGTTTKLSIPQAELVPGDWSHIAAQVRAGSMFLYVNGRLKNQKFISGGVSIDNPDTPILIGQYLVGYLKELRIWNSSKTDENVDRDHSRFVNGAELGLRVLLPMNEAKGKFAYDRSKFDAADFNENHARFISSLMWSNSETPSISKLNYRAYTDIDGNYSLRLPYFNAGEAYTLRPIFVPHEFAPGNKLVFVGDGESVRGGVDFEDISSFRIQGRLTYFGTNQPCGVEGAFLKVDGAFVLDNGQPEKTDKDGKYDIQVPIGRHFIELEQAGHIYSKGRYPPLGLRTDNKENFVDDNPNQNFTDSTLIKIIGKAVGGAREASKHYGKTVNNIGKAEIIWESESGCVLDTTYTSDSSGVYEMFLPPLKYKASVNVLSEVDADYYKFNGVGEFVSYDGPPIERVIRDSTFYENNDPPTVDTIAYNYEKIFQTFRKPKITVTGGDGENFIGEKEYITTAPDGTMDTLQLGFDAMSNLPLGWPVFIKGKVDPYRMLVKVFESYTNKDVIDGFDAANPKRDSVPTTVGTLFFNNTFADSSQFAIDDKYIGENGDIKVALNEVNTFDTLKSLIYAFHAGDPSFGETEIDRLKSLTIRYENPAQINSTQYWDPHYLPGIAKGDEIFSGYVLGSRNLGGNWFTVGPEMPEFILRDPPGSGSTATREKGSTHVKTRNWSWQSSNEASTKDVINAGAKFVAGVGVAIESVLKNDLSFGFSATVGGGRSGEIKEVVETTEEWSTNSTTDQVGAGSDIYIGKSQNFEHSFTEILSMVPSAYCSDPTVKVKCLGGVSTSGYVFAEKVGFEMKPEGYETNFIYSQSFILTRLIPEIEKIKVALLQTNRYENKATGLDSHKYGTDNDDPIWGDQAADCGIALNPCFALSNAGPSYIFNGNNEDTDSVRWINQQIRLWQEAIELNEWEKANISNPDTIAVYKQRELDKLYEEYRPAIDATIATGVLSGAASLVIAFGIISIPVPGTAIAGTATFALTTASSIANAEVAEKYEKWRLLDQRIKDKYDAIIAKNYSLSSGTSLTRTFATTMATSVTGSFDYSIEQSVLTEVVAKVNNTGVEFEKGVKLGFEYGREWSEERDTSEKVSFTLSDDDQPDYFSVDVYESILGFGPIFKMKEGGQTSCPYEDEVYSQFYKENDEPVLLSGKTRQIDVPELTCLKPKVEGIPANKEASFVVNLKNATLTGEAREFRLGVLASSNKRGAVVKIDGLGSNTVFIGADETVIKTVSIKMGPDPTVLKHDSILLIMYAPCQYEGGTSDNLDIVDSVYLTAYFLPSCSDVELQSPLDQWVVNNSFNNTLDVVMSGYDVNFGSLERLKFRYKKAENPEFDTEESFWIDTSGQPDYLPISKTSSATLFEWDVSKLKDGPYDILMESACPINNIEDDDIKSVSQVHSGYIDRINPHAFGAPSPADGILDPNDDILIRFNEPVNPAIIELSNFEVTGLKNGDPLKHEVSLFFDGDDYATIPEYQLQSRSFTIEFWMRRDSLGEQIILSQGQSPTNQLAISFNTGNQLVFQLGQETVTSDDPYVDLIGWHHYAFVYDRDKLTAEIFVGLDLANSKTSINTDYGSTGNILVGKHAAGNMPALKGFIHELRFWSTPRSKGELNDKYQNSMSGRESGLIGSWSMNEAIGTKVVDKVRARHAVITGASWSILPPNHSFSFDGSMDYLESSSTTVWADDTDLNIESDITFEGWFKTSNIMAPEQTLLSNGKADGSLAERSAWRIYLTSDGTVKVENDGKSVSSPPGYNDGLWHHFSVVVERSKAVSFYMDSDLVTTGNASTFRQLAGPKFWIGCRGWFDKVSSLEVRDQYFDGRIDELRIWNLARKPEQIKRDYVHQMSGDELGLQVYYPFDEIVEIDEDLFRIKSLSDQGHQGFNLDLGGDTPENYDDDVPPVKLPRKISDIRVTFSVNNDEIFIDILEEGFVVENTTLDITVSGIKDFAGNVLQGGKTWIAYINKNQVFWEEEYFQFEMKLEDNLTFKSKIKNTGGSQEAYSLSNLPSWLSASPSSGLIEPNSTVEVTFTVQSLLNIGEYEQDVFVTTGFGFNERLLIDLKVTVDPPDWVIDEDEFAHSMNITGQLLINDVISTDTEDMISVWVNDSLRGVSHVEYDPSSGKNLVFLTILSDSASSDILVFKAWDASRGRLLVNLIPTDIPYTNNQILGNRTSPLDIKATVLTELTYVMKAGWNWISFPLAAAVLSDVDQTLVELSPTDNDEVNYLEQFNQYFADDWTGSSGFGFDTEKGYKIRLAEADTFRYEGSFIDPSLPSEHIDIDAGWNWIGLKSEFIIDVPTAMASLDPQTGDVIKGQRNFAIYEDGFGWGGNLDFLQPQVGYMLKYHRADTLIYPGNLNARTQPETQLKSRSQRGSEYAQLEKSLDYVSGKYSSTMSLIAEIDACIALSAGDAKLDLSQWSLVAHAGDECRGVVESTWLSNVGKYVYYLSIEGSSNVALQFKLVHNSNGSEMSLSQTMQYVSNSVTGMNSSPYQFTCIPAGDCIESSLFQSTDVDMSQSEMSRSVMMDLRSDAMLPRDRIYRFRAGNSIELILGFEVMDGATLEAYIEDCITTKE
jgi:hypothetical protein